VGERGERGSPRLEGGFDFRQSKSPRDVLAPRDRDEDDETRKQAEMNVRVQDGGEDGREGIGGK